MAAQKRKQKRVNPKSVMVYFPGEKAELLKEIEDIAKDMNMPMSILCLNLMKIGIPTMRHYADALKGEGKELREYRIKVEKVEKAESKLIMPRPVK